VLTDLLPGRQSDVRAAVLAGETGLAERLRRGHGNDPEALAGWLSESSGLDRGVARTLVTDFASALGVPLGQRAPDGGSSQPKTVLAPPERPERERLPDGGSTPVSRAARPPWWRRRDAQAGMGAAAVLLGAVALIVNLLSGGTDEPETQVDPSPRASEPVASEPAASDPPPSPEPDRAADELELMSRHLPASSESCRQAEPDDATLLCDAAGFPGVELEFRFVAASRVAGEFLAVIPESLQAETTTFCPEEDSQSTYGSSGQDDVGRVACWASDDENGRHWVVWYRTGAPVLAIASTDLTADNSVLWAYWNEGGLRVPADEPVRFTLADD
jgi:hypothetical protein